jgi:hypothetical protein
MISSLKFKPVNWVDGMKLSSAHFIATDQYNQDFVRDARSIFINNHNFGLLPPSAGQRSSLDLDVLEKATNHLEVKVRLCNAVTAEGCRIDLNTIGTSNKPLEYNHYFPEYPGNGNITYNILLSVNPFQRVPSGSLDPQINPPRFPDVSQGYSISILPVSEMAFVESENYHLLLGQFVLSNGKIAINDKFITPSSSVSSHQALIKYYELFSSQMNDIQLSAFTIVDKTQNKNSVTVIGQNIRIISEKMLDYFAQIFYEYRNFGYQESPARLSGYFSKLAHVFFTGVKLIESNEREAMLRYFYEWRDVTPGNFEELLASTIELVYDHHNIYASMSLIEEFLQVISMLWKKLSTLEYIGQHKENIVVAEQQIVQQVQAKRAWTLLD